MPVAPDPPTLLTYAESADLRRRVEAAVRDAEEAFLQLAVIRDRRGVPIAGPDPRAIAAETSLVLARLLARRGFDMTGATAFEAKIKRLETELLMRTPLSDGSVDGDGVNGHG